MARKNVNITVTMDTDAVFIGDICYALDEEIYHKKWGEGLNWADGKIQVEGNGEQGPVCAVVGSTATGDGCYKGSDGTVFGVDAGVIGVTNLKYLRDDENVESLNQLGKVIDIPGGECFVTLIDENGEFYITVEDMQHNKLYSVSISTGKLETPTCIECGAEISDFENYRYGGVCEDCYRYQDYEDEEEEEDLYECCDTSCTSAEFQRMAPGKNAKMIGMKKRSLGKKDKYNTLGEKSLKEAKSDSTFLKKVAKIAKVKIASIEYFNSKEDWMVVLDSEDSYDADSFRDAVDDLLGANSGEHSYDDLIGLGDVHLGTAEYYEVSDDDYSDLDPAWRNKVVVYCEPSKRYKARRVLGEKRTSRPNSKNELLEKDVKAAVLKAFQEFFEGNDKVVLPKKLTSTDTSLPIQINGKKTLKVAIKVLVNEELGTYALDGLTNKDRNLLPDSYFQGTSLEEAEKDAKAFAKDVNKLVKESLKESKSNLKENTNAQDKVLVRVHVPNDYYDKFGNPVNAEKYGVRLEEIDNALFEAGAEAVWEVTSNPEAGWEGDDFSDTGFRRMTVAQLRVAIENGGIEEDEIRVYDNDIDVDRDNWTEYMNQHPEIDPWDHTADFDIYEDHRIYDINSLIYDADDDLDESCTSGEFQRMAPGKVVSMTAYKGSKKALGKKDKYNRLGESNKLAEAAGSFPIRKVVVSPRWITDTGKETVWITAEINGIPCAFPFKPTSELTVNGCDCDECIVNYEMMHYSKDVIDASKGTRVWGVATGGSARSYFLNFGRSTLKSIPKENQKDFRFTGRYYSTRPLVAEFKKLITTAFNADLLTEEFRAAVNL